MTKPITHPIKEIHHLTIHNNGKGRKRIHDRDADGDHFIGKRTGLAQIVCHGQAAKTALYELEHQKEFGHGGGGEERYEVRQRACEIVGIRADKFATQRAKPGIEQ